MLLAPVCPFLSHLCKDFEKSGFIRIQVWEILFSANPFFADTHTFYYPLQCLYTKNSYDDASCILHVKERIKVVLSEWFASVCAI